MPGRAAPVKGKTAAAKRADAVTQDNDAGQETPGTSADPAKMLVEHTPTDRLVTQRGLFGGPSTLVSDDLYAEVVRGAARRDRDRVIVEPSALVSMNTY